jgi:hypothetical protein
MHRDLPKLLMTRRVPHPPLAGDTKDEAGFNSIRLLGEMLHQVADTQPNYLDLAEQIAVQQARER